MPELAEEYLQSVPVPTIDDTARMRIIDTKQSATIECLEDEKGGEIAGLRMMVEQLVDRIRQK